MDLPLRRRNGGSTFALPIPRRPAYCRVDAANGFERGGCEALVRVEVGITGVLYCDIAVMLPHEQGRMSEVPCTGEPVHTWWLKIALVIGGGRRLMDEGMATSRV